MLSWGGRGDSARLGGRPARWLYTGRVSRMSRRPPLLHTEWGSQAKPHLGSLLPPKPLSPGPPHPTHRPHAVCSCHLPAHLGGLELQGGGSGRLQPGGPRGQGRASPPWSSPLQAGQKEGEGGKEGREGSRTPRLWPPEAASASPVPPPPPDTARPRKKPAIPLPKLK